MAANEKSSYLLIMAANHIKESPPPSARSRVEAAQPDRVVQARELLGGANQVWIEHAAERYLLRITRSGKLILTK